MITLYLVRHGESECPSKDFLQGQIDSPLTEFGARQAQAVADHMATQELTAVYASDLRRTVATAEAIALRQGLPVIRTPLIREMHLGEAQGLTIGQFRERYPDAHAKWQRNPLVHRPPGAERFEDVIARCGRFLGQIRRDHSDGDAIAVGAHVGSICGTVCAAFSLPASFYISLSISNCSLTVLDIGDRPVLRVLNDTCHLASINGDPRAANLD